MDSAFFPVPEFFDRVLSFLFKPVIFAFFIDIITNYLLTWDSIFICFFLE